MVDLSSLEGLNQNYFSPFLIFIKGATALPDKELLKLIHLDKYETVNKANENQIAKNSKGYLFVAKNNGWVYIMDDWSYSLWYDKEVRENLRSLSRRFEVFYCSVGDIDDSHDFAYFKNGQVIREYVVEDPFLKGGVVVKDVGTPFPIEKEAFLQKDIYEKVITVAKSLGIAFNLQQDEVRIYHKDISQIDFSEPF